MQLVGLSIYSLVYTPNYKNILTSRPAPVNLIYALNASLKHITSSNVSLDDRFRLHREASARIKRAAEDLGLKQVPQETAFGANGMTAVGHIAIKANKGLTLVDIVVLPRRS